MTFTTPLYSSNKAGKLSIIKFVLTFISAPHKASTFSQDDIFTFSSDFRLVVMMRSKVSLGIIECLVLIISYDKCTKSDQHLSGIYNDCAVSNRLLIASKRILLRFVCMSVFMISLQTANRFVHAVSSACNKLLICIKNKHYRCVQMLLTIIIHMY